MTRSPLRNFETNNNFKVLTKHENSPQVTYMSTITLLCDDYFVIALWLFYQTDRSDQVHVGYEVVETSMVADVKTAVCRRHQRTWPIWKTVS